MAYFDTSAIVAYYCPEELSEKVEDLIVADKKPIISPLTITEVASALSRKIRERSITKSAAQKIWAQFDHHRSLGYYNLAPIEFHHFNRAVEFITRFDNQLRTLDAIHLAVADGCSVPIVTADGVLAKVAEVLGVDAVLIT